MSKDAGRGTGNTPTDMSQSDSSALISAKDETISTLREQLQAERQAHSEARRLLAAALERIPAIEAPRESPETVEEVSEGAEPRSATEGSQAGTRGDERRPWWRRIFGG